MKKLRLKRYVISSDKIRCEPVRLHFLCDLHTAGDEHDIRRLLALIGRRDPDVVLIGGDMIVGSLQERWPMAQHLVTELARRFPVYCALGNHEQQLTREWRPNLWGPVRQEMLDFLDKNTVLLDDRDAVCTVKGERLHLYGLSLEPRYFEKPFPARLTREHMTEKIGSPEREAFTILLAHDPLFGDAYFSWGADLTLSGHYHGGVLRIGENFGLISPHFHPFPRYCCGKFSKNGRHMIVSAGLGEHTVTVRIGNPRELIEIDLRPSGAK